MIENPAVGMRVRYFFGEPGPTGRIIELPMGHTDEVLVYFGTSDGVPNKNVWVAYENLVLDDIQDPDPNEEVEVPDLPVESLPEPASFTYTPDTDPLPE